MKNKGCFSCKWCDVVEFEDKEEETYGICKRFPPQCGGATEAEPREWYEADAWVQPIVLDSMCCGEYEFEEVT